MKRDAKHVKGIVEGLIQRWEQGAVKKTNAVMEAWCEAVEEKTKKHTRPVSLKNGVLMVIVENSSWLYKLTLEKKRTIEKFNEGYPGRKKVKDIRFRVGVLDNQI